MDPFETLGVSPVFGLDLASLEQRHRDLSRAAHPDRHAASGAAERRRALGRAIEINEAFRILKDPVRRAEALLARLGVPSGEGKEPPAAPAFLMGVMERREALAEIRHTKNQASLSHMLDDVRKLEATVGATLTEQFARSLPDTGEILKRLGELRYYRRFSNEAEAIADELY